ncbi:alpha/beta hydrolase [bacterium]|nr:MAG: alpha/beta hydrolase [bacterium]
MDRFIDNAGVKLHLEVLGSGPRHVLFAHGWISSRRMWYDLVERFDPAAFTLYLLDFRGAGRSDRPLEGHDLEGYASDLRAAITVVEAPVTVVAHSMGGKVAQYAAIDSPRNLAKLALITPGTARAYTASARHRQMALDAYGSRERIERFQRAAMVREVPAQTLERIVDDALIAQREAWFGWYDHGRNVDFAERLGEIALPSFAVAGERDPLVPPSRVKRDVAQRIPGCLFVTLREVGHNVPIEASAELAEMLVRFV